jgi:zinc transport system ATP-binding protein
VILAEPILTITDLWYGYSAKSYILRGISLTVLRGEYVSIAGENGCGKSTFLKLILGFLKPQRGSITCTASRVGYVQQKTDYSGDEYPITVLEMLTSYCGICRVPKSEAMESLAMTGLELQRNSLLGDLSGGQLQKALISRALIGSPELVILDEPSTGIDNASSKEIYGILRGLSRERGVTVLTVEHNMLAAIENSSAMFHIAQGHGHICTPENYVKEYLGK